MNVYIYTEFCYVIQDVAEYITSKFPSSMSKKDRWGNIPGDNAGATTKDLQALLASIDLNGQQSHEKNVLSQLQDLDNALSDWVKLAARSSTDDATREHLKSVANINDVTILLLMDTVLDDLSKDGKALTKLLSCLSTSESLEHRVRKVSICFLYFNNLGLSLWGYIYTGQQCNCSSTLADAAVNQSDA